MAEVQNGSEIIGATVAAATTKAPVVFSSLKPQLVVEAPKAPDAVAFYKAAFGAEEVSRTMHPKRKADQELPLVLAADLKLGSSVFSVSDRADDTTPVKGEGAASGLVFVLETEDIDGAVSQAVGAGAVVDGPVSEVEGAGRVAKLTDPYGTTWLISSPAAKTTPPSAAPAADVEATAA